MVSSASMGTRDCAHAVEQVLINNEKSLICEIDFIDDGIVGSNITQVEEAVEKASSVSLKRNNDRCGRREPEALAVTTPNL